MAKRKTKNVKINLEGLMKLDNSNINLVDKEKRGVVFVGTEKEICEYLEQKREIEYKKMYQKFKR